MLWFRLICNEEQLEGILDIEQSLCNEATVETAFYGDDRSKWDACASWVDTRL